MKKSKYIGFRPTWAEINLTNLAHNFRQIKKRVDPKVKIMVTVKADAYGHGLIPVTKKLISCGVDCLGVASIDEGIQLRKAGVRLPVLILGMILKEDIRPLFDYSLTPTVCELTLPRAMEKMAKALSRKINVHVKVDTGMGRIGVLPQDARALIKKIYAMKYLSIEGIFSHFPFADMNKEFTLYQIDIFNTLLADLEKTGIHIPFAHTANSMGVIDYPNSHLNMIRPGLVIYGLYPKQNALISLLPVLSLKTKVIFLKKVPKGAGISYGHEYVTKKNTTVVTLPIGYGDGYPRNLSNQAPVLIRGRRFGINGKICMDQVMVDVGDAPIKVGDEVVLIGQQGKEKITAEELAELAGTIAYEIVCGLGSRIPRVYLGL